MEINICDAIRQYDVVISFGYLLSVFPSHKSKKFYKQNHVIVLISYHLILQRYVLHSENAICGTIIHH